MDSHKNYEKREGFVQMAKWIEWMLAHNEWGSAPCPHSYPAWDLCERNTFGSTNNKAGEMIAPA